MKDNVIISFQNEKDKRKTLNKTKFFYKQMETIYELFKQGKIEDIFIILELKDKTKAIASNGIAIKRCEQMAKDFLNNTKEYID